MEQLLLIILLGIIIGAISGLLGIGGGTMMIPLFRLVLGLTPLQTTATSLFTMLPTSIAGFISHIQGKTCIPLVGVFMGIGGALTSPVGVWLSINSPQWLLMCVTAAVIGYSAISMLVRALIKKPKKSQENWEKLKITPAVIIKSLIIGILTGGIAGYIGLGGGFLMVPLMNIFLKIPMKYVSGTSLVGIVFLIIPAVIFQMQAGNVQYLEGIMMACGTIPGAIIGSKLIVKINEKALRIFFSCVLAVVSVLLVVNELYLV